MGLNIEKKSVMWKENIHIRVEEKIELKIELLSNES